MARLWILIELPSLMRVSLSVSLTHLDLCHVQAGQKWLSIWTAFSNDYVLPFDIFVTDWQIHPDASPKKTHLINHTNHQQLTRLTLHCCSSIALACWWNLHPRCLQFMPWLIIRQLHNITPATICAAKLGSVLTLFASRPLPVFARELDSKSLCSTWSGVCQCVSSQAALYKKQTRDWLAGDLLRTLLLTLDFSDLLQNSLNW